jgi:two-component system chemotaxis sensor kinase CheA
MDDLVNEFIGETRESLALLDRELVRFEQTPGDMEILSNIFRMMHTIKGTCGFLGLPRLEKIAHAGEDVLGKFRDGKLIPTSGVVSMILECIDQIRGIVDQLGESGGEGAGDDSALIDRLRNAAADSPASEATREPASVCAPAIAAGGFPVAAEFMAEFESATGAAAENGRAPPPAATPQHGQSPQAMASAEKTIAKATRQVEVGHEASKDKAAPQTIRVSVDVLENLMTLVSEMVLTRNQLLQLARSADDSIFKEPIQRLSRTTSELQEGVMKTRMQPIGGAWGKLPRIVRDLANELGKKINLDLRGEDTELDRQVLELIQDPLTHMVRNSADHGLEPPAERRAAGKPETGTIRLTASHEGGHIIIEISDDGRGLNTEKIRAKVLERNLASAEELAAMDDHQVNQFIMRAGFSTAEAVTKVSGRGVGMDVVRSNVEKIGGAIEFRSVFGQGSVFTIKIPLTLAIVSALLVQCGEERFALPQIAVNEVVRISERSEHRIEAVKGAPVLRLRDRILPLVNLSEVLQLNCDRAWHSSRNFFQGYVVVCRNGSQVVGVIVDGIADSEEIVVKPLSPILGGPRYFSGNTILGDGKVILILDMNGLVSTLGQESSQTPTIADEENTNQDAGESILLFRTSSEGVKAVPLSQVNRIESFEMAATEVVQGEVVVQYRNRLLPLLSMEGAAGVRRAGRQPVLVFERHGATVGLAVESIIDIVHDTLVALKPSQVAGVAGSGIVAGRAVDIIDPGFFASLVSAAVPQRLEIAA